MDLEAGEIRDSASLLDLPADYDPSHEWPGPEEFLNDAETEGNASSSMRPVFRLLVIRTSVLPAKQVLAVSDGYTELQFGRDVSLSQDVPRIRLKEMGVSKLHATAYWDNGAWRVVDMGSKHGTFLQPRSSTTAARLSPPRVASPPRQLRHLDALIIGSTTFLVHIHNEPAQCSECCSTAQNEIPLFQYPKRMALKVSKPSVGYLPASNRDHKEALTMLKQRLLSSSTPGPSRGEAKSYVDRSARRRSLYPASRLDAPGVTVTPVLRAESVVSSPSQEPPWEAPVAVTISHPATPLPTTNIGHRLLLAQGWTPGSSLGVSEDDSRIRLTAPLEVAFTTQRAGIGMKSASRPA